MIVYFTVGIFTQLHKSVGLVLMFRVPLFCFTSSSISPVIWFYPDRTLISVHMFVISTNDFSKPGPVGTSCKTSVIKTSIIDY